MAKLFSVKLANLETEIEDLKLNTSSSSSTKLKDLESRVNELDNKLNQMVDELTTILNQHATAIKELTKIKT